MTTRYYEIRECEHGKVDPHWYDDWKSPPKVRTWCPGGLRRELTGVEVVEIAGARVVDTQRIELFIDMDRGKAGEWVRRGQRLAIIPLDDPNPAKPASPQNETAEGPSVEPASRTACPHPHPTRPTEAHSQPTPASELR